jgi:hypothetical protein
MTRTMTAAGADAGRARRGGRVLVHRGDEAGGGVRVEAQVAHHTLPRAKPLAM